MKFTEKQISALRMAAEATKGWPVTVIGARKAGVGPVEKSREIADATARSLRERGLVVLHHGHEDYIGGEDYVYVEITDSGRAALAELDGANDPHTAPETFMGVPVPKSLAHDWDHVHAIWWRYGVRAAIEDIGRDGGTGSDWRLELDTNPEEGIKR